MYVASFWRFFEPSVGLATPQGASGDLRLEKTVMPTRADPCLA